MSQSTDKLRTMIDGSAHGQVSDHTGRMVLTPSDPHATPYSDLLIETLVQDGFIGDPLPERDGAYCVGPQFLSLVAFTGCAVQIGTNPDGQTPFCHVVIPPPAADVHLYVGRNTRAPRCEGCRSRLPDWQARIRYWRDHPRAGMICANCGVIRPPWLWDWKRQGGFGRLFIQIEEVFPGEASPTHALFDLLTRASGTGWRHFYVQD